MLVPSRDVMTEACADVLLTAARNASNVMPTPGTHTTVHRGYNIENWIFWRQCVFSFILLTFILDNKVDKIILLAVQSEGRRNEATLLLTLLLL